MRLPVTIALSFLAALGVTPLIVDFETLTVR